MHLSPREERIARGEAKGLGRAQYEEMMGGCVCLQLRKATRVVTQIFDKVLSPSGLRSTQLPILATLSLTPSSSMASLAEQLMMDRTTLTRNLRPLVRRAMIRIVPGEDRRIREVKLTKLGRDAVAAAAPLWEIAQAGVVSSLGEERRSALLQTLAAVVGHTKEGEIAKASAETVVVTCQS